MAKLATVLTITASRGGTEEPCPALDFKIKVDGREYPASQWIKDQDAAEAAVYAAGILKIPGYKSGKDTRESLKNLMRCTRGGIEMPSDTQVMVDRDKTDPEKFWLRLPQPPAGDDLVDRLFNQKEDEVGF